MPRKKQAIHASGLVEVKATVGKDISGKRIQKSFYGHSKLEAKQKADDYLLELEVANRTGASFITKEYTFTEWANKWLELKKDTVKPYTFETTYKVKIDKYLIPYFKNANLNDIKQADIQSFFNKQSELSKSMLNKFRIILYSMFDLAIDNDLCHKNPVKNINISEKQSSEKRTYTKEQRAKLVGYCIEHGVLDILILLKTGVRRSELLGLTWKDINTNEKYISVNSAVTPENGTAIESSTKSASSNRIIPIDDELNNFLLQNIDPMINHYIVTGTNTFMSPSGYAKKYKNQMTAIASILNIPELTPHELRHTFGTLLRDGGADIYTIQKAMGHSTIDITAKTYVHNDIEVLRKAMKL